MCKKWDIVLNLSPGSFSLPNIKFHGKLGRQATGGAAVRLLFFVIEKIIWKYQFWKAVAIFVIKIEIKWQTLSWISRAKSRDNETN